MTERGETERPREKEREAGGETQRDRVDDLVDPDRGASESRYRTVKRCGKNILHRIYYFLL